MKRLSGYCLIGLSYLVALAAAYFIFEAFDFTLNEGSEFHIVAVILLADVSATVIVWLFGVAFKNSSFYDPYWSLVPFVIILFLMLKFNLFGLSNIILLCILGLWSWRLTYNWAYTFTSIKIQDWRYDNYKNNNSRLVWHIINFVGINMMPTMFVFFGLLPAIFTVFVNPAFNLLSSFGIIIVLTGVTFELFADASLHRFKKMNDNKLSVLKSGLWKYSRHPNYFGEILVWIGVYFYALPTIPEKWLLAVGAVFMILLFVFISIPMAEKRHLQRRPDYAEYKKKVSALFPLPPKK